MRPVKKETGFFLLIFKRGESVMVFSSASFLIFFLPCLLVLYFLVPRRCRYLRNLILLAFSLAFYACGGPKFLLLMLLSIVINYVGGLLCAGVTFSRSSGSSAGSPPAAYCRCTALSL